MDNREKDISVSFFFLIINTEILIFFRFILILL